MVGYHVLWANEFIPIARETYIRNHSNVIVDARDIRQIQPEEVLEKIGKKKGEVDVLEGSPPCAAFSTAGKRAKGWGQVKSYSETRQRVDDLFFEFARVLKGLQPKVFVAENVSGLVKGVAKGYFKEILSTLRQCGYKVQAKLLDAQWLGVPQMRQRIIFCGVREDLNVNPIFPKPFPYRYSVRDAIPWIESGQLIPSASNEHVKAGRRPTWNACHQPSPTVVETAGEPYFTSRSDKHSYVEPETDISRYAIGKLWDEIRHGESHPTRHSLNKPSLDKPCPTILQRMANKNGKPFYGASIVHPFEKRYLSIVELKRICAFPDDFELLGTYAQQWERLGRSVPPVMMYHIAKTIQQEIFAKL
jgi:DNA (cytosine-5)-methyltransferase 1